MMYSSINGNVNDDGINNFINENMADNGMNNFINEDMIYDVKANLYLFIFNWIMAGEPSLKHTCVIILLIYEKVNKFKLNKNNFVFLLL